MPWFNQASVPHPHMTMMYAVQPKSIETDNDTTVPWEVFVRLLHGSNASPAFNHHCSTLKAQINYAKYITGKFYYKTRQAKKYLHKNATSQNAYKQPRDTSITFQVHIETSHQWKMFLQPFCHHMYEDHTKACLQDILIFEHYNNSVVLQPLISTASATIQLLFAILGIFICMRHQNS